ncbi:MAG: response regulator, partial [Ignavibacteria bacterium]|nr:response regulator [Ignavibacteria bacterium]
MNIAITDDHEIVREGLKKILTKHDDLKVVAEASSIAELEKLLEETQIDFITLDISLPDRSGLD